MAHGPECHFYHFNDYRWVSISNRKIYVASHKMCDFMDAFSYEKAKFKISQLEGKNSPKNTERP